ncbi:unnamed protein product [Coregonus sp. 'balchen']|nr:unnamed protein product [Coregonus sp. 'balchen']
MWAEDDFTLPFGVVRLGLTGPQDGNTYIMYHGTSKQAADQIKASGFRQSSSGMLGRGVYLSRDLEKASRYPLDLPEHQRVVIRVKVNVGKVKRIDYQYHPLQTTWHENGYDTAWVPPMCGMVKSGLEEDCVWDPKRITVLSIAVSDELDQIFLISHRCEDGQENVKMEGKSKGLKQQQQHHKKLLAAIPAFVLCTTRLGVPEHERGGGVIVYPYSLEDLDDLRMEGVTGLAPSGSKFSQGRSSYCPEPQAKVTLNICSRLQGDSLSDASRPEEDQHHGPSQHGSPQHGPLHGSSNPLLPEHAARQAVWKADVKVVRGGGGGGGGSSSRELLGQTGGLLLSDSLFSKELENMGKHLAEVEKDLAKLAEQGKLAQRSPNSPHSSLLLTPLFHTSLPGGTLPNTLPLPGQTSRPPSRPPSRPQSPVLSARSAKPSSIGYPLVSPKLSPLLTRKPTSLTMTTSHRTHSPSNPGSRSTTPRTPSSRPMTPNSLLTSRSAMTAVTPGVGGHGAHKEVTFRRSRSRPDEFYQQLQAIRQPWHVPSDTESGVQDANKRSVFSGL